jgi:hypothetical protein
LEPLNLSVGRSHDDDAIGDDLVRAELIAGQVDLQSAWQAVPPVEIDPFTVNLHLAAHQISAENVIEHDSDYAALAARRVAGIPRGARVGRIGIRAPRRPNGLLDICQRQECHSGSVPRATDIAVANRPETPRRLNSSCIRLVRMLSSQLKEMAGR